MHLYDILLICVGIYICKRYYLYKFEIYYNYIYMIFDNLYMKNCGINTYWLKLYTYGLLISLFIITER